MTRSSMTTSEGMEEGLSFMERECPEEDTSKLKTESSRLKGTSSTSTATNPFTIIPGPQTPSKWKDSLPDIEPSSSNGLTKKLREGQLAPLRPKEQAQRLEGLQSGAVVVLERARRLLRKGRARNDVR